MNLSTLQELKDKLRDEKVLSEVWKHFLDHFGENPEFRDVGEPTRDEFLEAVVNQVGQKLFPKEKILAEVRLIKVPEQSFIHGGCTVNGRVGGLIYFENDGQGLLVVTNLPPSTNIEYVRFSSRKLPLKPNPSVN